VPNRLVYHVVPSDHGWLVQLAGDSQTELAETRREAIERAKDLARRAALGAVIVLGEDGRVEQELLFGDEPQRTPR
jgi:hypothetical protein